MNLRFWGGWFLVLAGIGIMLTMGCEKGALGVKSALVTGRIVDKDNSALGIPNATVKMVSSEQVGMGELPQGNNFLSTVTDANGNFIFENVVPDNVLLEVQANGYTKVVYPGEDTAAADDEPRVEQAADSISVRSGSVTNVGSIALRKISNPLPEQVMVKLFLRDARTRELISDSAIITDSNGNQVNQQHFVSISFNNQTPLDGGGTSRLPSQWAQGVPLKAENSFLLTISAEPQLYVVQQTTIPGSQDVQIDVYLEPVTYQLLLRAINAPDYLDGQVFNVFAEAIDPAGLKPPKVIATHSIVNNDPFSPPDLPQVINVPGLALPVNLRVQVRGYRDEVVVIQRSNLPEGSQGTYRLDIDFLYDNSDASLELFNTTTRRKVNNDQYGPADPDSHYLVYDPQTNYKAGMFNNMIRRDVAIVVAGEDLLTDDIVTGYINLPYQSAGGNPSAVSQPQNQPVTLNFPGTAVGYKLYYSLGFTPMNPGSIGSGSYVLTTQDQYPDGIMINPPVDNDNSTLVIGVRAERPKN